ncbi:MAG: recombinase zinc beta ribbon domain-containing protein [Mucilaginibacter sp.]|nr:recombinase zinc beta ribbon domain-containing protein [Mucilaginibacter sp.]
MVRINADKKNPERIIKGLHEAIIPESQFWRAQQLLDKNKRKEKVQRREDFPLRGILRCPCGTRMTAGFSKGKKNYYLYYRCLKHDHINIPGRVIHPQLDELIKHMSLNQKQLDTISERSMFSLKGAQAIRTKQIEVKKKELKDLHTKIERLEERIMNEEIESETYKKYFRKYQQEKALISEEISYLSESVHDKLAEQLKVLPSLLDLSVIFEKANLNQKHAFLGTVFKHGLSYKDGAFRTPHLHPAFCHNMLKLNKKGLLFVEQPSADSDRIPCCAEEGTRTPTPRGARS